MDLYRGARIYQLGTLQYILKGKTTTPKQIGFNKQIDLLSVDLLSIYHHILLTIACNLYWSIW